MSETELDSPGVEYSWREPPVYMKLLLDSSVLEPEAARILHERVLEREQAAFEAASQGQYVQGGVIEPSHEEYGHPQYGTEPPLVAAYPEDDTLVPMP